MSEDLRHVLRDKSSSRALICLRAQRSLEALHALEEFVAEARTAAERSNTELSSALFLKPRFSPLGRPSLLLLSQGIANPKLPDGVAT